MSDAMPETVDGRGAGDEGGSGGEGGRDPIAAASDAFAALGSETRMGVVRTLFEAERDAGRPVTRSFSALFEASDEETTAGFAYHLRELPETYVQKVLAGDAAAGADAQESEADGDAEAGYRLTAAGRRVARAIAAGTLTESADRAPVNLSASCPFCAEPALTAAGDDTVLTVACGGCEREILALPFPPAGYRAHDDGSLPTAVNDYYRGRIATMREGTCPECGGPVETAAELLGEEAHPGEKGATEAPLSEETATDSPVARARMACTACGYRLRCPVTLTVLDEPAVVAAFHAVGVDLSTRPLWNVGPEWGERVVSTDPLAVRVTAHVGDTDLACFVGRDLSVVYTDQGSPDDDGNGRRSHGTVADDRSAEATPAADRTADTDQEGTETGADSAGAGEPDSATA
jgi:hypothetical protein